MNGRAEQPVPVPVLEIGGTHLTAALVHPETWTVVPGTLTRLPFDGTRSTDDLIADMAAAAATVPAVHSGRWAVAIPGPFDYDAGIGRFEHVGKFDALRDVNVRERLQAGIEPRPRSIRFLNDADAFGVGEYATGAAKGARRAICITLGTGVGSAFLEGGNPVNAGPTVPPDGSAHLIVYRGRPLEETVSRRAIRSAFAAVVGVDRGELFDVREIAEAARSGDPQASRAFGDAFTHLGHAIAPWITRFDASVLVVGGSMARSWDLVEPALRNGLAAAAPDLAGLPVRPAGNSEHAPLVGAAYWSAHSR